MTSDSNSNRGSTSSDSSDSEEFYDAEDITPSHANRKSRKPSRESLNGPKRASSEPNVSSLNKDDNDTKSNNKSVDRDECLFAQPKPPAQNAPNAKNSLHPPLSAAGGRRRFKELRQRLHNDDEDIQNSNLTPPNSQTSSVDGVSACSSSTNNRTHPFRIIEQDTVSLQSLNSLGRIGRILGSGVVDNVSGNIDTSRKTVSVSALSSSSLDSESTHSSRQSQYPSTSTLSTTAAGTAAAASSSILSSTTIKTASSTAQGGKEFKLTFLQEPDVIASTKTKHKSGPLSATASSLKSSDSSSSPSSPKAVLEAPVAPPRRKKKYKNLPLAKSASSATFDSSDLASPASTIESLTREFEHSLDRLPSFKSAKSNNSDRADTDTLKSGHSLDINQAIQGQFVVKPQDNEYSKALPKAVEKLQLKEELPSGANTPRGSSSRSSVGHYSLGPHRGTHQGSRTIRERRKSAGDENFLKDVNLHVRTHTDSGKQLSDFEILEQIQVLNLDTGEKIPLSVAEDKLPKCVNPLSLHIMRLTSEYVSNSSMDKEKESDEESVDKKVDIPVVDDDPSEGKMRKKTAKIKRFFGTTVKKTVHKAKSLAQEVSHARHKEDTIDITDHVHPGEQLCKLKASNSHKGPYEFEKVEHVQELKDEQQQHDGPIWCMKFSSCGRLLATAGQDKILRVWVVRDAYNFFHDMRMKYNAEKVSPTPSTESLTSQKSACIVQDNLPPEEEAKLTFMPRPFCTYTGHTSDLLDVSWSKNYFILSSSMDKTVRLWHISRKECLCCFQHIDFVTAIVFHPRDDRYFLSGSLDGKLRLWNIPDKKVAVWNEVEGNPKLITAANFCQNGKFAVVGTYDGRCIFYVTDQLRYHTQIHVRSSRGRNSTGRKISGIEPMPGEDKILVTSNDSRIRLYDLRDLNVSCKYKGYVNMSSQIKASFSHDGKYIISGSENRDIYIWKTHHDYAKFSSVRRDRNDFWEAIKAHSAVVTCAIFAPNPEAIIKMLGDSLNDNSSDTGPVQTDKEKDPVVEQHTKGGGGYVLISADFNGCIKVFINKTKPKHSSLPVSAMA